MDNSVIERIENNFINIYNKFDILDEKLNNYYMKFDKIINTIDIIISDEYTKIYKTYFLLKILIYCKTSILFIMLLLIFH